MKSRGGGWIVIVAVVALFLCPKAGLLVGSEEVQSSGEGFDLALASENSSMASTAIRGNSYVRRWWINGIDGGDPDNYRQNWPKFEFNWSLLVGSLIGMLGSALGSVGGVGGGGFYLPMLNVVMGFDAKTSTALSKAMVMGAAISSVMFNLKEKHPTENRTVIDYEFSMLFQPMILLGISIGVILNVLLPEWVVTLFLVVLFSRLAWTAFKRAVIITEQERKAQKDKSRSLAIHSCSPEDSETGDYTEISSVSDVRHGLPEGVHESITWQWFPWKNMAVLIFTWLGFLSLQIIKVHVPNCSLWYWLATILQVPIAFGVTIWEAFHKSEGEEPDNHHTEEAHSGNEETRLKRDGLKKFIFSLLGLVAGVVGGLLGVGGGGIMGPGFLELGLSPQVSSATASFIMVFSSSLSVAEFYLLGRLPADFAIYLTLIAMVASAWGQAVIKKVIQASGKSSIIVFVLVGCILTSTVVLGVIGFERSYNQWESGANMGFQDACD